MATSAGRAPRAPARTPKPKTITLPRVEVARFEEAMRLVEQLVDETEDVFVAKGQAFRERHRDGTERKLTAQEAAQVAAAWSTSAGLPPVTIAEAVQQSELRAYDEPEPIEILLRAGVATAPAAMGCVKRFVALIEMPAHQFRDAREADGLDSALDDAVNAMAYEDLTAARPRAQRALEHFANAAGDGSGKALSLLPSAMWQALQQATSSLGLVRAQSSLTGSPPSTDGLGETSSTTSDTPAP